MDTATKTETRCEAVTLTLPWTDEHGRLNVAEGDLIDDNGRCEQIADVAVLDGGKSVCYELDGDFGVSFALPKDEVTVYRYIETTEE